MWGGGCARAGAGTGCGEALHTPPHPALPTTPQADAADDSGRRTHWRHVGLGLTWALAFLATCLLSVAGTGTCCPDACCRGLANPGTAIMCLLCIPCGCWFWWGGEKRAGGAKCWRFWGRAAEHAGWGSLPASWASLMLRAPVLTPQCLQKHALPAGCGNCSLVCADLLCLGWLVRRVMGAEQAQCEHHHHHHHEHSHSRGDLEYQPLPPAPPAPGPNQWPQQQQMGAGPSYGQQPALPTGHQYYPAAAPPPGGHYPTISPVYTPFAAGPSGPGPSVNWGVPVAPPVAPHYPQQPGGAAYPPPPLPGAAPGPSSQPWHAPPPPQPFPEPQKGAHPSAPPPS